MPMRQHQRGDLGGDQETSERDHRAMIGMVTVAAGGRNGRGHRDGRG